MRVEGISIVVPCFNGGPWIKSSLLSLLAQQAPCPIEIVVVDDGSSDDSVLAVQSLNDARIRLLRGSKNQGTAATRNLGVRAATFEWIAFNDQDDIWLPGKLTRQCALVEHRPEIEGVVGGYARLAADGVSRWTARILNKSWSPSHSPHLGGALHYDPARHGTCYVQSLLIKKAAFLAIGGFRECLPIAYDPDLMLRLGEVVRLGAIEEPVFLYRLTLSSITGAPDLDAGKFLAGFAFMNAAQAARRRGLPEPDLQTFLAEHKPTLSEIQRFAEAQCLRNINTHWVNGGLRKALMVAAGLLLSHPSLLITISKRLRWWSRG